MTIGHMIVGTRARILLELKIDVIPVPNMITWAANMNTSTHESPNPFMKVSPNQ